MIDLKSASRITIIAKPNSPKTEILGYDQERQAYRVNVHAKPEAGKANIELVKFFSKLTKKRVRIVSGLTSKEKVLVFE
jgi:uncharacterized protein (TIGR00251 family)